MVLTARKHGLGPTAAYLAAILGEPGRSMRGSSDLRDTLRIHPHSLSRKDTLRASVEQIARLASIILEQPDPEAAGILTALAYPDRIARRQENGSYRLTSGRKAVWPGPNTLAGNEFLAIADLDGDAAGAKSGSQPRFRGPSFRRTSESSSGKKMTCASTRSRTGS